MALIPEALTTVNVPGFEPLAGFTAVITKVPLSLTFCRPVMSMLIPTWRADPEGRGQEYVLVEMLCGAARRSVTVRCSGRTLAGMGGGDRPGARSTGDGV